MIVDKKGDYTNYTCGYSKFAPSRFHHSLILTWWIDRMIPFALVPSSPNLPRLMVQKIQNAAFFFPQEMLTWMERSRHIQCAAPWLPSGNLLQFAVENGPLKKMIYHDLPIHGDFP